MARHKAPSIAARALLVVMAGMLVGLPIWNRPGCCVANKLRVAIAGVTGLQAETAEMAGAGDDQVLESAAEVKATSSDATCACCCQPVIDDQLSFTNEDQPEREERQSPARDPCPQLGPVSGMISVSMNAVNLAPLFHSDSDGPATLMDRISLILMLADLQAELSADHALPDSPPMLHTPDVRGASLPLRI